jgi:anti-anti-sigma factor
MKLTHEDLGQLSVLTLKGEFTGDHAGAFQRAVDERLAGQVRDFVVNVADLEFIDSVGLEALLKLQDTCADLLGQVRLAGVKGNIEQILRITRLTPRFDAHPTVDAAVKSLRI